MTKHKPKHKYYNGSKNLVSFTSETGRAAGKKGGKSKSPAKQLAVRMNGILANKKLNPEQTHILQLMKDKKYLALANEFITLNSTEGYKDPERRDKVIGQLQAYIPKTNLNYNINEEKQGLDIAFEVLDELGLDKAIKIIGERLKKKSQEKNK